MDRIDAMRALVTSVDCGSLAAAARKLGCSAASVTRAIASLENRLGMRLLHRNTRALHLTQFGETYLATCQDVLATLDLAEHGAAAERERPSGLLTVTAPLRFCQLHVRTVLDACCHRRAPRQRSSALSSSLRHRSCAIGSRRR